MKLIIPVLLNCFLVLGIYLADKHTPAKHLSYTAKQVIIGILFGCVSAFASSYGVQWLGTVVNVRDAAPLSAGLIFGAPAGIMTFVTALIQITMSGDELLYQIALCIPALTAFTVAASVALRRIRFTKAGFFLQFVGPVLFMLPLISA